MVDRVISEKPVYSDDEDGEFVGTAYKFSEMPEDVYYKNEEEDGCVVAEFDEEYSVWYVKGKVLDVMVVNLESNIILIKHEEDFHEQ